ncbi:methylated-DNA--[protein]-cysteine S-methyltransferase [Devosia sp.]|uniref:methylated-DNA--[protein]-cysteine S-methyltransferase n=1 Tax=Devosia sp. TaxID=1871048 RepID=UPI003A8FB412
MLALQHCLLETAIGTFAVGWSAAGIGRVALPGRAPHDAASRAADWGRTPGVPTGAAAVLAERISAYADGRPERFDDLPLDLTGVPDFHRRCYAVIGRLGWGETTTYGAIARELGDVGLSRAVGAAMGANPIPLVIPCHRVLGANGKPGGFSAPGGVGSKLEMLRLERAATPEGQLSLGL